MHPFFAPLDPEELTLLLTTMIVGGSQSQDLFKFLPQEKQQRLQTKVDQLLQIPSEKRVQLMVLELKNALALGNDKGLERIDPSWLVHALKGASPRIVGCVLYHLSTPTVRAIMRRLPTAIHDKLPAREALAKIPQPLMAYILQNFSGHFHPMPAVSHATPFQLKHLLQLQRPELYIIIRDLGLAELGQAFVAVGRIALAELCRRLPREKAEELIYAVKMASHLDIPGMQSAQYFLSQVTDAIGDTETLFQCSGLWRLAKAFRQENKQSIEAMGQRLPRRVGLRFWQFIEEQQTSASHTSTDLSKRQASDPKKIHDMILVRLVLLSQRAVIDERYAQIPMAFYDEAAAKQALFLEQDEKPPTTFSLNSSESDMVLPSEGILPLDPDSLEN